MVESDSEEEITKAEEETVQNSKFKTPEARGRRHQTEGQERSEDHKKPIPSSSNKPSPMAK